VELELVLLQFALLVGEELGEEGFDCLMNGSASSEDISRFTL
jgi:hypothetical protein